MRNSLRSEGIIFILSSPSGGGKSSLAQGLIKANSNLKMSVSVTTRKPRAGEVEGVDYFFKTTEEFSDLIDKNLLLETTKIYGNYYGTPITFIKDQLALGTDLLFDLDVKGVQAIRNKIPDQVVSIFILPPNLRILAERLNNRGQDSEEVIKHRLQEAKEEIKHAVDYDYVIINEVFENSLDMLNSIIKSQRLKMARQDKLEGFLETLR